MMVASISMLWCGQMPFWSAWMQCWLKLTQRELCNAHVELRNVPVFNALQLLPPGSSPRLWKILAMPCMTGLFRVISFYKQPPQSINKLKTSSHSSRPGTSFRKHSDTNQSSKTSSGRNGPTAKLSFQIPSIRGKWRNFENICLFLSFR